MNKIVLTWWTFVWKTSILRNLSTKWYTIVDEVAQKNIQLLKNLLWDEDSKKWRQDNFLEFQRMNIFSNLNTYNESLNIWETKDWLIFYDRWIFDWFASLTREWIPIPKSIENLCHNVKYDIIFVIEHLSSHDPRKETWRMLNFEKSKKWEESIIKEYTKKIWIENIITIPKIIYEDTEKGIEERTQIILDHIINIKKS